MNQPALQVSAATRNNWKRLSSATDGRLRSRANKLCSDRLVAAETYIRSASLAAFLNTLYERNERLGDMMFTLALQLLDTCAPHSPNTIRFRQEYGDQHQAVASLRAPDGMLNGVQDGLGYLYQSLTKEGERNARGQYYTNARIVEDMLRGLDFSRGQRLLDPCCGSGAFLLGAPVESPDQLFGIDIDPVAVMIAKANIIAKFPQASRYPNIYCQDFLDDSLFQTNLLPDNQFDYVCTNPPWGTTRDRRKLQPSVVRSNERSSLFVVKGCRKLRADGTLTFLLPTSILKVATHEDVRSYFLHKTCIAKIKIYQERFNGVFTDFFSIQLTKGEAPSVQTYEVEDSDGIRMCSTDVPASTSPWLISMASPKDEAIIAQVEAKRHDDLSHSLWGLGIVTGDNRHKLSDTPADDLEPIFTGKEIRPYTLDAPRRYVRYRRDTFQQCARDEMYRAPEKLVYRFIANRPVFAYDDGQHLMLNSANILIPQVSTLSAKVVMAFLNSELFSFVYRKRFHDVKVLKGNLQRLPLPQLSADSHEQLEQLVTRIIGGDRQAIGEIDRFIYHFYQIDADTVAYISDFVGRKS